MNMKESKLRSIIREELVREKVVDVEPYDGVSPKVTGTYGSSEVSVEVRRKGAAILTYNDRGKLLSKAKLGREEAQEIANALT